MSHIRDQVARRGSPQAHLWRRVEEAVESDSRVGKGQQVSWLLTDIILTSVTDDGWLPDDYVAVAGWSAFSAALSLPLIRSG